MRLIAIDASPINGGPASYAVEVVASSAEAEGAEVIRVRLYDVLTYACTRCGSCTSSGRCTKRDGLLDHACRVMAMADSVMVGAPARFTNTSLTAVAMLRRFLGAFAGYSTNRGLHAAGSLAEGKRAAVLAAGGLPGMAIAMGQMGVAGAARGLLMDAGVALLPGAPIPGRFTSASTRDVTREVAERLGRRLASEPEEHDGPRKPGRSRRRRTALTPSTV